MRLKTIAMSVKIMIITTLFLREKNIHNTNNVAADLRMFNVTNSKAPMAHHPETFSSKPHVVLFKEWKPKAV
jgi:hypothetical protein